MAVKDGQFQEDITHISDFRAFTAEFFEPWILLGLAT